MAERLKKEEKEREERRKRVEAIMSRTRAKGAAATPGNTPVKVNTLCNSSTKLILFDAFSIHLTSIVNKLFIVFSTLG